MSFSTLLNLLNLACLSINIVCVSDVDLHGYVALLYDIAKIETLNETNLSPFMLF
jgi:hypothetical protein